MLTLPNGRAILLLDSLVVIWTVAWITVGIDVRDTLYGLTELSRSFRSVGTAVGEVGRTLGGVNLPILGPPLDRASDAIELAGRDILSSGVAARAEIERASALVGSAVALVPTLTLLLLYTPARVSRVRDRAALRSLVVEAHDEPGLEDFLATRAIESLPYRRLRSVAQRPWEAGSPEIRRALAEEELRRLGIDGGALARGRHH